MERNLDWYFKGKLEDARDEFMKFIESKRGCRGCNAVRLYFCKIVKL